MTVLAVVKDVCAAVGVAVPGSVFAGINSNRTMQEMLALANEMAQRIAYNTREWTALKRLWQFGGGTSEFGGDAFPFPADFKRMLLTSQVWRSTSTQQPMRFIADTDEWYQRRFNNDSDAWGEWTRLGDSILTWPGFSGTQRLVYLDKNCVALASGGYGDSFMADGDSFRLDERLLKLGMQWQWKALKGAAYAEDMGTYSDAVAHEMGADQPAPIMIDRRPISWTGRAAYPWALPS